MRPPSPPHGRHGRRLLRRVGRAAAAGRGRPVQRLAGSAGRGHRSSAPAASVLVVSRERSTQSSRYSANI